MNRELDTFMTANPDDNQQEVEELQAQLASLRQQVEKYRAAFEYSGDSIFILDASGTQILDANSNAARRLGYDRDELLTMNYKDIQILPDKSVFWESSVSSTLVYECSFRSRDGSLIPVEVSSRAVILSNTQVIHHVVRDISIRKAEQAEREQLIEDLDAFSYTVAHNLKSPLTYIAGFAEVLMPSVTGSEDQQHLQAIVRSAMKMNEIIEGLLLLARVRTQTDWQPDLVEMGDIVASALEQQGNMLEDFQPEIVLPDSWPLVLGYAPWVEAIWTNYISNAIKYGGSPPRLELGFNRHADGKMRFWVRDNGPGLTSEESQQLFTPFIRLGVSRTSNVKGYGLGLSIVRRIVDKLDGEAGVDSAPGQGSTFWFTLPLG